MNYLRFYIVDETDAMNPVQTEVMRSAPNALQPNIELPVPIEFECGRVRCVVGYGNTDVYLYCIRPEDQVPAEPIQTPDTAPPPDKPEESKAATASTNLR